MAVVVMKFGGTSVADVDRIRNVARHVKREVDAGNEVAVVVSAMSGKTNELVAWVREASALHDAREYDAVVASGEQVTAGLLAIVLQSMGMQARSWQGWQIPIRPTTRTARPASPEIDGAEHRRALRRGRGRGDRRLPGHRARAGRIATLGRGGSDTSAVAMAAASRPIDATSIPTSTASTPPTRASCRRRGGWRRCRFEEMLEMASLGAKVLQTRSVELAMVHRCGCTCCRASSTPDARSMRDRLKPPGTLICDEEEIVEQQVVSGIAYAKDEAKMTLVSVGGQAGRRRRDLRAAGRRQHQRRHDRPERLATTASTPT